MRLNYRKLGEYIELVSCLNADLHYGEGDVRGVSNNKKIIQTKANNKGRDFNNFYVVAPNEFIYNSRTSRMGEKVGLGYNDTEKTFITSFNNTVFRVINESMLPMYLFMWFNRPEFDRYVRFHSWGSSTEIFSWNEMCNTLLPVPSVEKQREIVGEYKVVQNRLKLNNQLIQKLEETAQAIYKQWFVDFEFPDENGKPYKSNGGAMVYNEELDKEIPEKWEVALLDSVCKKIYGYPFDSNLFTDESANNIPLIRIRDILNGFSEVFTSEVVDSKYILENGDLLIGMDGTFHMSIWYSGKAYLNQRVVRFKPISKNLSNLQVQYSIRQQILDYENNIQGTTVAHLSDKHIKEISFIIGDKRVQELTTSIYSKLTESFLLLKQENQKLSELKELLLSKLATVEN